MTLDQAQAALSHAPQRIAVRVTSQAERALRWRLNLGFLSAFIAALTLCACSAESPMTCPPPADGDFPIAINRITPLSMPLGQFLGRTREQNETLLTSQSVQPLTGWVMYAPGFHIRYRRQQAIALKATLDIKAPWQEVITWAGFLPAAAPICQDTICRWEMGQLCYGSQPLAAMWKGASSELHVWRAQTLYDER